MITLYYQLARILSMHVASSTCMIYLHNMNNMHEPQLITMCIYACTDMHELVVSSVNEPGLVPQQGLVSASALSGSPKVGLCSAHTGLSQC